MQDNRQTGTSDAAPQMFFMTGARDVAGMVADWLEGAAPVAFDADAVAATMRTGRRVFVVWCGPEACLERCLADGHGVARALTDWAVAARDLLALFRQNRRKMMIAEAGGLLRAGPDVLAARFGRAAPDFPATSGQSSPLAVLLARLAQHNDAEIGLLLVELGAASMPCPEVDLGAVMEMVADQSAKTAQSNAVLVDQLDLVATQSQSQAEQLVQVSDSLTRATQHLADSQAALKSESSALVHLKAEHREANDKIALLQSQIALMQGVADHQIEANSNSLEASVLQANVKTGLLSVQEKTLSSLAERIAEQDKVIHSQKVALEVETAKLARALSDLADLTRTHQADKSILHAQIGLTDEVMVQMASGTRSPDADLLSGQIALLQDLLDRATTTAPAAAPDDPAVLAPRTDGWDKALAAALAATRTEADLRARLERELHALRSEQQNKARREEDIVHNRRLFAMMTTEANAALDEIARLAATKSGAKPATRSKPATH